MKLKPRTSRLSHGVTHGTSSASPAVTYSCFSIVLSLGLNYFVTYFCLCGRL